jgi:hypothetical protein
MSSHSPWESESTQGASLSRLEASRQLQTWRPLAVTMSTGLLTLEKHP